MTNITKTPLTAADHAFMAATYPGFAGDKWDAAQGGNMPSHANHLAASLVGCRLGSKQALALSLTMRDGGSTAAQRTYAGQGKTQNNIGGLQDLLRQQHKTAKLTAGQPYVLKLSNGAVLTATSNMAGHIACVVTKGPNAPVAAKVASKVAAKAKTPALTAPKV